MVTIQKILLPKSIENLVDIFPVDVFIVGGKVRSHLLNLDNDDIDLCSSLKLDELEKLLDKTEYELKFKNETLGTAKIICGNKAYDYATLRREIYEDGGYRQPIKVEFVDSIEEDYRRRDFSINAIYYNVKDGSFFDFCNGVDDIKKKVIRCVKDPFEVMKDDGVRILRMIRIACELNFRIDKNTFNAAAKNVSNLSNLSGVRVASEVLKICDSSYRGLCKKNAYLRGIKLLNRLKIWKSFGLSFEKLKVKMVKKTPIKYLGLLIDIINSENPASISYFLDKFFDKLQINKKKKEELINIISGYYDALNRIPNKIYFAKYFDNFEKIYEILSYKSKILAQKYNFFYKYIISHKIVIRIADLKVSNRDIAKNFPSLPKKSYNVILNMILNDIFEGKYNNEKEIIIKEIEKKLKYY